MKKLQKAAEKYGLTFSPETFGYRYFFGIQPLLVQGAYIGTKTIGCNIRQFEAYCKKYGYTLKYHKFCGDMTYYTVCKNEDSEKLNLYADYMKKSVDECEMTIHHRHIGYYENENDLQFNARLSGIMQKYENMYKDTLKSA
jgi:hypothetical protein